jgi:hypothetical protein
VSAEPLSAVAVKVTIVSWLKIPLQVLPQFIPRG